MLEDIRNFLPLSDNLLSSGMPTADQFAELSASGVQVVINLATPASEGAVPDEAALVEALGMKYIGIPVEWDRPTPQDLGEFMNAMDAEQGTRILVHCQANFRATGFISLYRFLRLGWKREAAFKDLRKIWNPDEYPVWRDFMNKNLGARLESPPDDS